MWIQRWDHRVPQFASIWQEGELYWGFQPHTMWSMGISWWVGTEVEEYDYYVINPQRKFKVWMLNDSTRIDAGTYEGSSEESYRRWRQIMENPIPFITLRSL